MECLEPRPGRPGKTPQGREAGLVIPSTPKSAPEGGITDQTKALRTKGAEMGFLDKAKQKAGHLAEQAKDKIEDVKEKRKVDDLLDELGRIVYRQRTERGEAGDEAEIVHLVRALRALEAEGTEVLAPASAPADVQPPPPPPPADASSPRPD
jgi:hypothetical protein